MPSLPTPIRAINCWGDLHVPPLDGSRHIGDRTRNPKVGGQDTRTSVTAVTRHGTTSNDVPLMPHRRSSVRPGILEYTAQLQNSESVNSV